MDQYFRLPAALAGDDGSTTIFSDFRAVGVRTHVRVVRVPPPVGTHTGPLAAEPESATVSEKVEEVLYDGWTSAMNAVEYAYAAPLEEEAMKQFFKEEQLQHR